MTKDKNLKIQLSQINTRVGDLDGNCNKILHEFKRAEEGGCDLVMFCEMSLTGYPCGDLWKKKDFIKQVTKKISEICEITKKSSIASGCAILLGAPTVELSRDQKETLHNSAILIDGGEVKKIIHKKSLPNYGVFDEKRYFEPASTLSIVEFRGLELAILVCEDLWDIKNTFLLQERIFDATIVINSSPYSTKKHEYRYKAASQLVSRVGKPLLYLNQVGAEDSLVFDGSSFVMDGNGKIVTQMKEFEEDSLIVELKKEKEVICSKNTVIPLDTLDRWHERDYLACTLGLRDYMGKNSFKKVLLGMSGGVDSAIVAAIAVDALGSENVSLYALPSRYNSEESMTDAINCAKSLGVKFEAIAIDTIFESMLFTLRNHLKSDSSTAEENLQSRIRGNILMALSNASGALLLTTGNKSELAVGYATIYGDMCGSFNPIKDLYKTKVYELTKWRNENVPKISLSTASNPIPQNILTKEPSAELRPNQKDSDSLPEYEILDRILFGLIEDKKSIDEIALDTGFAKDLVKRISKLFYASEYKRKQSPLGPKISDMSFDEERRYPITNRYENVTN